MLATLPVNEWRVRLRLRLRLNKTLYVRAFCKASYRGVLVSGRYTDRCSGSAWHVRAHRHIGLVRSRVIDSTYAYLVGSFAAGAPAGHGL